MVAAYGSRTPRPCRWSMCYYILVAGTTCSALISRSAYERLLKERAWRGPGWGGRVARRASQVLSLQG